VTAFSIYNIITLACSEALNLMRGPYQKPDVRFDEATIRYDVAFSRKDEVEIATASNLYLKELEKKQKREVARRRKRGDGRSKVIVRKTLMTSAATLHTCGNTSLRT
jgi:hypothetical protein